jgi:hypothetical protein
MRTLLLVLCTFMATGAVASPVMCGDTKSQHANLLSPEQWQAVLGGRAGGDPVLEEAAALERIPEEHQPPEEELLLALPKPRSLTWAQARTIILLGAARQIIQSHNLTVQLFTRSGKTYKTREPRINEVWKIAAVVDPCGLYIRRVEG